MDLRKQKSQKRLDLQGIRAIAIISVLGFHFYKEWVPNGYVGVDQFFVLSGFLMCMLLTRAENESPFSLACLFYSKRFKRILPLYLLVILISMICLYNFFPDTAVETNKESAVHALLFVSNRPSTVQEDYFSMLAIAVDLFIHTWSLSVEIQFYLLIPMIFLIAFKLPERLQNVFYGFIGFISVVFFYSLPSTKAFNSVFARIWQFLIGMIVYNLGISKAELNYQALSNEEREPELKELLCDAEEQDLECCPNDRSSHGHKLIKSFSYFLLIALLSLSTFPFKLPALVLRPLVTMGTGLLMLLSKGNLVLTNKFLTYLGDISYSLYLIHWPIYAYWKLTCDGNKYLLIAALTASVLLAVFTFESFEKWYLQLSSPSIGLLVVVLFFLNVVVINKDEIFDHMNSIGRNFLSLDNVTNDMTIDDAERLNYRWSVNDNKNLFAPTCVYESKNTPLARKKLIYKSEKVCCLKISMTKGFSIGLSPKGKYKLAIIGNSWTANHAKLFYQECAYKAKSIMQGAAYGCEPFYPTKQLKACKDNFTDFEQRIRNEKPDFAFIFTRYVSVGVPFTGNVTSFKDDSIYQTMKGQMLKFISNIRKKLYILNALPSINRGIVTKIAPLLKNATDPVTIDNLLVVPHGHEMARNRYEQLVKDCQGKCELVDYLPEFYNNSTRTIRYFDEKGFSYWTTPQHLSPHGIEHIRHLWTNICTQL